MYVVPKRYMYVVKLRSSWDVVTATLTHQSTICAKTVMWMGRKLKNGDLYLKIWDLPGWDNLEETILNGRK